MSQHEDKPDLGKDAISFIFDAPFNEEIVNMDCNDYCEELAQFAEQVANGADVEELLPELERHMKYWTDCREEFEALVAVLKAEQAERLLEAIDDETDESPSS